MSYLNTKPLVYGFEHGMMEDQVELLFDYPARVANMLLSDEIDIGLIPVTELGKLSGYQIISDYCIGASEAVASVCLFSEVPIDEVEEILLDYQSRTSVALLKILLKEYWKIQPRLIEANFGYEQNIKGTTAGLVIGDRALLQRKHSTYIFDLAEAWQTMTGLPFVFAVWVANKQLPAAFKASFNLATAEGFKHIDEIVVNLEFPTYDMQYYYRSNIDYVLDERKRAAIELFLLKLS